MSKIVYLNSKFVKFRDAKIHIEDRGLQFSDSVYEVVSILNNKFIDYVFHIKRLKFSLKELDIKYKVENKKLVPDDKEFLVLQSMISLRKSGLGYRKISDEIKNKFGKRIYFPQVHKILNRPHNRHI